MNSLNRKDHKDQVYDKNTQVYSLLKTNRFRYIRYMENTRFENYSTQRQKQDRELPAEFNTNTALEKKRTAVTVMSSTIVNDVIFNSTD